MKKAHSDSDCRTLTEAYSRLGIAVSNPRTAWSAQSNDGAVVLTLWSNFFADADRRVYDEFGLSADAWKVKPANKRRTAHLKFAAANNDGIFQSIVITQSDRSYAQIVRREIGPTMRLIRLDETTGQFRAERVTR